MEMYVVMINDEQLFYLNIVDEETKKDLIINKYYIMKNYATGFEVDGIFMEENFHRVTSIEIDFLKRIGFDFVETWETHILVKDKYWEELHDCEEYYYEDDWLEE